MAIIQDARSTNTTAVIVDPSFKAARITLRPVENEGVYRLTARSGIIAAATAAGIGFSFRYIGTGSCLIKSVKIGINGIAAYTQNAITYTLVPVRGFTTSDSSGTQLTSGNIQKLRSSMTQFSVDARIATTTTITAAAATAAVEDAAPIASLQFDMAPAITSQPMREFLTASSYSKSFTLTNNEGFRIRNQSAYGALGTCNLVVAVEWAEFPSTGATFY
jgi:hypothetical protein